MKKTNFLKGLALAAVALVSGFATSCSEEELSIKNNPVELPAASASVSISVVDLEEGKLVGSVTTIDATASIGGTLTVECPANAGYTTAAPVAVSIPALQKGQSVNVPVTFYVVTLDNAVAELVDNTYFAFNGESDIELTTEELAVKSKSNNWDGYYVANTDDADELYVWAEYQAKEGWEYVSEVEAEEETEEGSDVLASSRAAETTLLDLIKNVKPEVYTYGYRWNVLPMHALTVDAEQYTWEGVGELKNWETGEVVAKFVGKRYSWYVGDSQEQITHDNGHDNTHNGHGHGDNNNAGGGIGEDAGE